MRTVLRSVDTLDVWARCLLKNLPLQRQIERNRLTTTAAARRAVPFNRCTSAVQPRRMAVGEWDGHRRKFCLDGTGKLISRAEAIVEILAGTDWKLVPLASRIPPDYTQLSELLRPVTLREPTTLFTGTLQVTLTKRRPLL
ncbi:hypothetical protein B0H13DRAFT_1894699 [Mycena leptocephala]|nr:hypothetical protein B0H13DRAFT_1894699 [Mycena leptocephala]